MEEVGADKTPSFNRLSYSAWEHIEKLISKLHQVKHGNGQVLTCANEQVLMHAGKPKI